MLSLLAKFGSILALGAHVLVAAVGPFDLSKPTESLGLSGTVIAEDGAPLAGTGVEYTITVEGRELFAGNPDPARCALASRHGLGILGGKAALGLGGEFRVEFSSGEFVSTAVQGCRSLSARLERLTSLTVDARVENSYANCNLYCRAHSPEKPSSCLAACTAPGARLRGTRTLTQAELASLRTRAAGRTVLEGVSLAVDRISIP